MAARFHFLKRGAGVSEIEWQSSAMSLQVLIVYQSRSGATLQLAESLVAGIESASDLVDIEITTVKRSALLGTSKDVRSADALVIATPEHFGSMAGATKVFFEEIWAGCLDQTQGLPWQLLVKAGTDGAQTAGGTEPERPSFGKDRAGTANSRRAYMARRNSSDHIYIVEIRTKASQISSLSRLTASSCPSSKALLRAVSVRSPTTRRGGRNCFQP